jgi:hypothetical protein
MYRAEAVMGMHRLPDTLYRAHGYEPAHPPRWGQRQPRPRLPRSHARHMNPQAEGDTRKLRQEHAVMMALLADAAAQLQQPELT